jgi:CheY-like chemotaxis protein
MTCMNITVSHESSGWFVTAHTRMGPYTCREQALNLGGGMADAIRMSGGDVELVIVDLLAAPSRTPARTAVPAALGWSRPSAFRPNPFTPPADSLALRVLCAEDNPTNQEVLKIFLEMGGVACVMVSNGAEAVAAWKREPWDMILMDIQMPEMDGVAATRAIRALEAQTGRTRTPILAVTANVSPHQIAAYLAAEMDAVVSKPIAAPVLLAEMGAALDTPHGPLANAAAAISARIAPPRA